MIQHSDPYDLFGLAPKGEVSFHEMPDGFTLHAQTWAVAEPIGVCLYLHGWMEMIDSTVCRRLARGLNERDIALVAYDTNMHGRSMVSGVCRCANACCRGNQYPAGTVGADHCVEMARFVAGHFNVPFVLAGHSAGAAQAMLAQEQVASELKAMGRRLKGSVYLAPTTAVGTRDGLREACCCCFYCMNQCCFCCCCPSDEMEREYKPPGAADDEQLHPTAIWLQACFGFLLPERYGGLAGPRWWGKHHADVPYTILVGMADRVSPPRSQERMLRAAPHGKLVRIPFETHDLWSNSTPNWKSNLDLFCEEVRSKVLCPKGFSSIIWDV